MTFPVPLRVPIRNHLTGRPYELVRACEVNPKPATVARIVAICNEPLVYEWIFRESLAGRRYEAADAREWLEWSWSGWSDGTHFVFAVLDEAGHIAAACDIKSKDPVAEIGYWASQQHRGIMTNAVKAMCGLAAAAGFRGLFSRTRSDNQSSKAVLARAGLVPAPSPGHDEDRFELLFAPRNPGALA